LLDERTPYYTITQVASWLGVHAYALHHWENEFREFLHPLEPRRKGQRRIYTRRQAVLLGAIRELLYTELYTIAGAKRQLRLAAERERAAG
jgi:DNA-binding transcriptional MerR regulator